MNSTSGSLRLNLLFLVTIFRLDLMSTMAKPQEQIVSSQTVLVRDGEPMSSTVVYLDENTLSSYSATTIDTRVDDANYSNNGNNYVNQLTDDPNGKPDQSGPNSAVDQQINDGDANRDTNRDVNRNVNGVHTVSNKKPRMDEEADAGSHQPETSDHQQLHNEVTPAFNSSTAAPRRPVPSIIVGRPLNRDQFLAKEYFAYLCGTFDLRSLIGDPFQWSSAIF